MSNLYKMKDKEIETLLYNFENYKNYFEDALNDVAESSVGCGMATTRGGGITSVVEQAVMEYIEREETEIYRIIKSVLSIPKFAEFYCCRYVRQEDWKESKYSRRTYFRRKKNLISEIKEQLLQSS